MNTPHRDPDDGWDDILDRLDYAPGDLAAAERDLASAPSGSLDPAWVEHAVERATGANVTPGPAPVSIYSRRRLGVRRSVATAAAVVIVVGAIAAVTTRRLWTERLVGGIDRGHLDVTSEQLLRDARDQHAHEDARAGAVDRFRAATMDTIAALRRLASAPDTPLAVQDLAVSKLLMLGDVMRDPNPTVPGTISAPYDQTLIDRLGDRQLPVADQLEGVALAANVAAIYLRGARTALAGSAKVAECIATTEWRVQDALALAACELVRRPGMSQPMRSSSLEIVATALIPIVESLQSMATNGSDPLRQEAENAISTLKGIEAAGGSGAAEGERVPLRGVDLFRVRDGSLSPELKNTLVRRAGELACVYVRAIQSVEDKPARTNTAIEFIRSLPSR
jgi:hypothetical protein